jgi:hypothetical protein
MQLRVLQALNKWQRRNFDYGDADCCQFAGFVVKELTGKDYLADFDYTSEDEANDIIKLNGDLKDTVSSVLGAPTEGHLTDGSPVLVDLPEGEAMGIKLGNYVVCLVKKGFVRIPEESIITGWELCLKQS